MTCATEDYSESPYIDMCPVSKAASLEAGYLPCMDRILAMVNNTLGVVTQVAQGIVGQFLN